MKSPLDRIRTGALVLFATVVCAILGYRYLAGYNWIDSVWMVVVTISSVGYAEQSQLPDYVQLFTIAVILVGMTAAAYTIGGLFQLMAEGEIDRALGRHRLSRSMQQLKDHVIICGYGRIGQTLAASLKQRGLSFVVIDIEPERVVEAGERDVLCISGDATEDQVLIDCGLTRAKTLVIALPNDAANVFITLTARNLHPKIQIISRAELAGTEKKLRQAGADRVLLPAIMGAQQMSRMITRPTTAYLMELVAESSYLDVEMDEFEVAQRSKLVGVTVRETEEQRTHRLLVVAVKTSDGDMVFNPDSDYTFAAGEVLIVMGRMEDIDAFRKQYLA